MRKLVLVLVVFTGLSVVSCDEPVDLNVNEAPVDQPMSNGDDSDTGPGQKPGGGD